MREELNKPSLKFKLVQTKVFQVNSLLQGLSTYVPLVFDREFTSLCTCTLHGSVIDFRFRVKNQRQTHSNEDAFLENGILVERKYVDILEAFPNNNRWTPNNVAEYFFFDEFGFLSISERKIMECYAELTEAMHIIYTNLKTVYNRLASKVVYEDDLMLIEFPRMARELEMKGLEHYLEQAVNSFGQAAAAQESVKLKKAKMIQSEKEEVAGTNDKGSTSNEE